MQKLIGSGRCKAGTHLVLLTLLAFATAACGPTVEESSSTAAEGEPGATSTSVKALLDNGRREVLASGITSAENLLFSNDGRLFVTGDSGIYEIARDGTGTIHADLLEAGGTYFFGGMAQIGNVLYVNAYTAAFESYVFAAAITPRPAFRSIYRIQTPGLPNGATTDGKRLYVSDTIGGTVLRLTFDERDPFAVVAQDIWLSRSDGTLAPNGLKMTASRLYFTDGLSIKQAILRRDGRTGTPVALVTELTLFDDLYVDDRGIIVTNFLLGSLESFDLRGVPLLQTPVGSFNAPSAVLPANGRLGFSKKDLLVTEKGGNLLAVYHPAF